MRKDRDCGCGNPIYPNYQMPNMMPGVPMINNGFNMMPNYQPNILDSSYYNQGGNDQISALNSQIASLERRVSNLENLVGNNKYNNSNYQML